VVGIEAQLVAQLGVVEQGILGHLGVLADLIGLLEGVAGVVLLVQLQVAISHVVGGHLGDAVRSVRHQVELGQRLLAVAGAVVCVTKDVTVSALHTHTLGALLQVGQRLGIIAAAVVGLPRQAVDLVDAFGPFGILQQGLHIGVQLVVLALQEQDLGDVEGHHLAEVLIRLQGAEARERRLVVAPLVLDV